ncbi:MAG: YIP1 family protein [Anaerolineaceae bacterium]
MTQSTDQHFPTPPTFTWWQVWVYSFFRPGTAMFGKLVNDPWAGFRRAFSWAFLGSLGSTIAAAAVLFITGSIAGLELIKDLSALPGGWSLPIIAALLLPAAAFGGIISLLVNVAISHLVAKAAGGKGSFRKLVYGMSTYLVPAALVSMGLSFIPGLGAAAVLVDLYSTWLDVVAIKAVHAVSWGRAAAAAIVPFIFSLLFKGLLVLLVTVIIISVGR